MDIVILNRPKAREESYEHDRPDTAIISITDHSLPFNEFFDAPWLKAVLFLKFDDVIANGPFGLCITEEDAESISRFVLDVKDKVQRLIVHCEAGVSRSSGVAAAIVLALGGDNTSIFESPQYCPNTACYRKVLKAFNVEIDENDLLQKDRKNRRIWFDWLP